MCGSVSHSLIILMHSIQIIKTGRSEYIIWYYKFFEQPTVANVWNIGYRHPSKNPKAFDALVKLKDKPSWKSQSLISALNGLKELGDPRRVKIALAALVDIKSPRWWLAAPIWDYPIPACETVDCIRKS